MRNSWAATRQRAWIVAFGIGAGLASIVQSPVARAQAPAAVAAQPLVMPLPVQGLPAKSQGALIFDGVPPIDPTLKARIGDYLVGRDASFLAWLPNNTLLVSTRFADTPQVHLVSAPLGMREQLTWYPDPITRVLAPPAGATEGFAFLKEHDADARPQLYYYSFATHGARMLSAGLGRHGDPLWSPDGKHVVYSGNDRDGITMDIYMSDIGTGTAPHLVVAGRDRPWAPLDWSPDGQKLLLWQPGSNGESTLFIGDVNTGSVLPAEAGGKHSGVRQARFSADGRGIYISSEDDGDFAVLRYLDLTTHQAPRSDSGHSLGRCRLPGRGGRPLPGLRDQRQWSRPADGSRQSAEARTFASRTCGRQDFWPAF